MSRFDVFLLLWWAAVVAICLLVVNLTDAATLSITGNATGQGLQSMSYTGDINVSILANTFGCFWNVTGAV